ncbi:ArnT family glycosyltransferase [Gordonia insulae]|uniref:Glycosyltransferase RgtA/B/C/D-like domain-containing protein n=1 Tax=Gordonia insulae TaxID=2420509 RepID=A0A3G8JTB0_9ACTN|nr:glycosyltransferase family 39 protein [Gordonia insulae]AZG47955.1 hypothetical protein D7316_04567 [Gordonia insulae]
MRGRSVVGVFFLVWLVYAAIGIWLCMGQQFFMGDSLSRVQAAQSVLFSRDPHLSAIGFIFTPLTAMAQLPLTALTPIWPPMTTEAVSAAIMSAGFGAGAVIQVWGIARDRGVTPWMGNAVSICFAINPMIVFYSANGMSEAPFIFFLTWTVRRLLRWADTDDVHELIVAAVALALGYLTRYDGGAAAVAAAGFVAVVTFRRADRTKRYRRVVMDVALVELPSAVAFFVWAFTSWLITGNLFAQFSSQYGNTAILEQTVGSEGSATTSAIRFALSELVILAPLFAIVLPMVAVIRFRRRRLYPLMVGLAVIGAVLAFQILSYVRGTTFGFMRFYITVIPLSAIVALLALPATRPSPFRRLGRHAEPPPVGTVGRHPIGYRVAAVVAALSMVVAIPTTAAGMNTSTYGNQEFALGALLVPRPDSTDPHLLDAQKVARAFSTEREIAQYLDSLHLPDGSVICDTVFGFAVVVRSTRPKQFVIPSDQDFTNILNDPALNGVQYILTVPKEGRGESDAINTRYPTIYENGAQIGVLTLEARNQGAYLPTWRIYRVLD